MIVMILPVFLASCSWDPSGVEAQKKWLTQKKEEKIAYDNKVDEDQKNRLKKREEESSQFEVSHPEVEIAKASVGSKSSTENKFTTAMNSLDFVTRYPGEQTLDNVYVKVGRYNLTVRRFQIAVAEYFNECKRASAYNGTNYNDACISILASGLNNFSAMLKNENIPDKTKSTALSEASIGNYIDFEHAARLAKMHFKLCQQKGKQGYIEMVTVAAPCNGRSDVLNIYAARKMGFL